MNHPTTQTQTPPASRLRHLASRSAAMLREVTHPARVLAWWCPRCGTWVPPRRFNATTGTCRPCARRLHEEGVIPLWHGPNR